MTEPKDRLTKLLEAYRLAVENEDTDGGKERRELEKQIREHLTPDPATEKAADLWADKVLEASQGPDPATARTWLETALAAEGLMVKTDWSDNEKPPPGNGLLRIGCPVGGSDYSPGGAVPVNPASCCNWPWPLRPMPRPKGKLSRIGCPTLRANP